MQDALCGMKYRMGFKSKVEHGVYIEVIVECLDMIQYDADHADSIKEANQLWKISAFVYMVTSC